LRRKDKALAETAALAGAVKKTRGDLPQGQGRGRMIGLEDRQTWSATSKCACAGARLRPACQTAGITVRTLQRWKAHDGLARGRPPP
jgi:putative transposase